MGCLVVCFLMLRPPVEILISVPTSILMPLCVAELLTSSAQWIQFLCGVCSPTSHSLVKQMSCYPANHYPFTPEALRLICASSLSEVYVDMFSPHTYMSLR